MNFESSRRREEEPPKEQMESPVFFESSLLDQETQERFIADVKTIISMPERYVDQGGAGKVYDFAQHVCMKVLEDREGSEAAAFMDMGNTVEVEANMQSSLSTLEVSGVRVPKCYGYWVDAKGEEKSAILMEKLDAINLQFILNGDETFPEAFDVDTFIEALNDFMEAMHSKGVIHDDIAPRNVMVDRTTGLPRLIDFGRAKSMARLSADQKEKASEEELNLVEETISSVLLDFTGK